MHVNSPPAIDVQHSDTSSRLLDVAERLFAEQGIETVSIRQIVLASGQGNLSAAHYHFGSREGLIRALLERRMVEVDSLRHQRLDCLLADGRGRDVDAIVECAVGTLVDVLLTRPWGADYLRVVAQALFNRRINLLRTLNPQALSGLTRMTSMLRELLPTLPQSEFEVRMDILRHETVYAFDRWLHHQVQPLAAVGDGLLQLAAHVAVTMSHGVKAPPGRPSLGARSLSPASVPGPDDSWIRMGGKPATDG